MIDTLTLPRSLEAPVELGDAVFQEALELLTTGDSFAFEKLVALALTASWGEAPQTLRASSLEIANPDYVHSLGPGTDNPWFRVILADQGSADATVDLQPLFQPWLGGHTATFVRIGTSAGNTALATFGIVEPHEGMRRQTLQSFTIPSHP